jgi:hypothetical protein
MEEGEAERESLSESFIVVSALKLGRIEKSGLAPASASATATPADSG